MGVVKKILKAIVYLWAAFWAIFMTYAFVGIKLGHITRTRCKSGGVRMTGNSIWRWIST